MQEQTLYTVNMMRLTVILIVLVLSVVIADGNSLTRTMFTLASYHPYLVLQLS